MMLTAIEKKHLKYLIKETIKKKGTQFPNPAVGAMLINNNNVVSDGFHILAGDNHAEVSAIKKASNCSLLTLLITLEPCTHDGKTPPCVDLIIKSGIKRVIWAMNDPNPVGSGRAKKILERHDVDVVDHCLPDEAYECVKEFYSFHKKHRPYIYVKAAVSLDGMIAPNSKKLNYISSKKSRNKVQKLRQLCQAICVGVNTINTDKPKLNVVDQLDDQQPMIVILDPNCNVDQDWLKVTLNKNRVIMIFSQKKTLIKHKNLINIANLPFDKYMAWQFVIQELYKKGCHSVLVEGGSSVFLSIFESNCFDELWVFKVPNLIGSGTSIPLLPSAMSKSLSLSVDYVEVIENDVLIVYNNRHAFSL